MGFGLSGSLDTLKAISTKSFKYNDMDIGMDDVKSALSMMETSGGKNIKTRYEPKYHENLKKKYESGEWTPTPAERRVIKERGADEALKLFSTSRGEYQIMPESAYRYTSFAGDPEDLDDHQVNSQTTDELLDYHSKKTGGDLKKVIHRWNQGGEYFPKFKKYLKERVPDLSALNPFDVKEAEASSRSSGLGLTGSLDEGTNGLGLTGSIDPVSPRDSLSPIQKFFTGGLVENEPVKLATEGVVKPTARGVQKAPAQLLSPVQTVIDNIRGIASKNLEKDGAIFGISDEMFRKRTPEQQKRIDANNKVVEQMNDLEEKTKTIQKNWIKSVEGGVYAKNPEVFRGKFMENPSWTRALAGGFESAPLTAMAFAISAASKNPITGAAALGALQAADEQIAAREAGKSLKESNEIFAANILGLTAFEIIPITGFMKGGKLPVRMFRGAVQEGGEEGLQQIWTDSIAKVGYDETRKIGENIVESMVAGFVSGGTIGALAPASGIDQTLDNAREKGVDVDTMTEAIGQQFVEEAPRLQKVAQEISKVAQSEEVNQESKTEDVSVQEQEVSEENTTEQEGENDTTKTEVPEQGQTGETQEVSEKGKVAEKSNKQYHGTSQEIKDLSDTSYSTLNYYGQGFYTTNDKKIAEGYTRKGRGSNPTVYDVHPKEDVKLYNMEESIPADIKTKLNEVFGEYSEILNEVKNLREAYDELRESASADYLSADSIQEYFDGVRAVLESEGYRGLEHIGGLKTGKPQHNVKIYWNPSQDVKIIKSQLDQNSSKPSTQGPPSGRVSQQEVKPSKVEVPRSQLPVGTGESKPSKLADRMVNVLESVPQEQRVKVPEYKTMNKKEQIRLASEYVIENPKDAIAVLKGQKVAPEGLLHNSIALAIEQHATNIKDSSLILDIATLRSTRAGQEISILTEVDSNSPVTYIAELKQRRVSSLGDKEKLGNVRNTETQRLKRELKKASPKASEWVSFVNSIIC